MYQVQCSHLVLFWRYDSLMVSFLDVPVLDVKEWGSRLLLHIPPRTTLCSESNDIVPLLAPKNNRSDPSTLHPCTVVHSLFIPRWACYVSGPRTFFPPPRALPITQDTCSHPSRGRIMPSPDRQSDFQAFKCGRSLGIRWGYLLQWVSPIHFSGPQQMPNIIHPQAERGVTTPCGTG